MHILWGNMEKKLSLIFKNTIREINKNLFKTHLLHTLNEETSDGFFFDTDQYGFISYFLYESIDHEYIIHDDLGPYYHVVLMKKDGQDRVTFFDQFEGILGRPKDYVLPLLEKGYFGFVARKTDKSDEFVENIIKVIKNGN